ncbi:nucleoside hydrolase-like domain-containing protein, partial [Bacteroides cellulosilyticus]
MIGIPIIQTVGGWNIQSHQPLGKHYPDRKWATEGDSPAFFY